MPDDTLECDPELLRGNTESILLFLINERKAAYGYRLIKDIEERSGGFFRFKEGTVYPALHKLQNDGLIEGKWQTMPNGQERRCYRITPKGKELLRNKVTMWKSFASAMELIFGSAGA